MRFPRLTKQLGSKAVDIANELHMNLPTLAEHCHMSKDTLYDAVKGKRDPYLYLVVKLKKYCNKSYNEILEGLENYIDDREDNRRKNPPVKHKGKKLKKTK